MAGIPPESPEARQYSNYDERWMRLAQTIYRKAYGKRLTVSGREKIPKTGPFLAAANHDGVIDFVAFVASSPRIMAGWGAKEYFNRRPLPELARKLGLVPVNRKGNNEESQEAVEAGVYMLKQNLGFALHPEGKRVTKEDGRIRKVSRGMFRILSEMPPLKDAQLPSNACRLAGSADRTSVPVFYFGIAGTALPPKTLNILPALKRVHVTIDGPYHPQLLTPGLTDPRAIASECRPLLNEAVGYLQAVYDNAHEVLAAERIQSDIDLQYFSQQEWLYP